MSTSRTFLQNASTRHAIFVSRFAGSQIKDIIPTLERIRKRTVNKLTSGKQLTEFSKRRLDKMLKEVDDTLKELYGQMSNKVVNNMREFADYEADFSARMFTKATKAEFEVPASTAIEAGVFANPLILTDKKLSIEQALSQFSRRKRRELVNTIKDGVIAGKTNDEIVSDINFVTRKIQRNHANALVRTITNHVSTAARNITIEENKDLVEGYEWVSTLDGRTTHTCQSLDGKVFPSNSSTRPPLHWGCRSTIIPRVNKDISVFSPEKAERPAVGPDGAETVKGQSTYNSWLKKQPKEFQEEVLGPVRARLFRDGGLTVNSFVDKNFEPLTLKQLKRKEPAAFNRAGIDE